MRVTGTVTFDGAAPPANGIVYFLPIEVAEGFPRRPASGKFTTDGRFEVTSFEPGDGLAPGTYRVRVECWKQRPKGTQQPGINHVPSTFQLDGLTIDPSSGPREFNVDIPVSQ